jgi:hypothetical protein
MLFKLSNILSNLATAYTERNYPFCPKSENSQKTFSHKVAHEFRMGVNVKKKNKSNNNNNNSKIYLNFIRI